MSIFYIGFLIASIAMIPFAYVKSIIFKIKALYKIKDSNRNVLIKEFLYLSIFIFFGIFKLLITLLADSYYFWLNNFRTDLKKIVVENEKCKWTLDSFKKMITCCQTYRDKKMSAVFAEKFIKNYRE